MIIACRPYFPYNCSNPLLYFLTHGEEGTLITTLDEPKGFSPPWEENEKWSTNYLISTYLTRIGWVLVGQRCSNNSLVARSSAPGNSIIKKNLRLCLIPATDSTERLLCYILIPL